MIKFLKRNLMKLPPELLDKARETQGPILVAVAKVVQAEDLKNGVYAHLGLTLEGEKLHLLPQVAPPAKSGRWSKTNAVGALKRLRHLPKVLREFDMQAPDFGDWSKGSHRMCFQRLVYQTEYVPPKHLSIKVTLIEREPDPNGAYLIKFAVDEVLDPQSPQLEQQLFYDLNILQENVGAVDVYPFEATIDDYHNSLAVRWEIHAPRNRNRLVTNILRNTPNLTPERAEALRERTDFLASLHPTCILFGSSGFAHYFGAVIDDKIAVFENIRYENTMYIINDDWKATSELSRNGLLEKAQREFIRIPHRPGWQHRVPREIAAIRARNERGKAAAGHDPL